MLPHQDKLGKNFDFSFEMENTAAEQRQLHRPTMKAVPCRRHFAGVVLLSVQDNHRCQ